MFREIMLIDFEDAWLEEALAELNPAQADVRSLSAEARRAALHLARTFARCLMAGVEWDREVFGDLLPLARIAGREPPVRFVLEARDSKLNLPHLRELPAKIRHLGEKGLVVTRFKGLGEMDPEELWDTTLDPARRTMVQVKLEDALKAEEMFRTLMGEKVEPRREFIQDNALTASVDA